jgi:methionyl-tRNA formyltransferase
MKILFLGYKDCRLVDFLKIHNEVVVVQDRLSLKEIQKIDPSLIISYGYTHIIKKDVINFFKNRIINLHISFLPWNRGVSPNFWSIIDDTPKGVTIHLIDEGIDTGEILFQKQLEVDDDYSLKDSYNKLRWEIEEMFLENWDKIASFTFVPIKQDKQEGSYHSKQETKKLMKKLNFINNWDWTEKELKMRNDEEIINEIQAIREKNNTHFLLILSAAY